MAQPRQLDFASQLDCCGFEDSTPPRCDDTDYSEEEYSQRVESSDDEWMGEEVMEGVYMRSPEMNAKVHEKLPIEPMIEWESVQDKRDNCLRGLVMTIKKLYSARPVICAHDVLQHPRDELSQTRMLFRQVYNLLRKFAVCANFRFYDYYTLTPLSMNYIDYAKRESLELCTDIELVCNSAKDAVPLMCNPRNLDLLTIVTRSALTALQNWLIRHEHTRY